MRCSKFGVPIVSLEKKLEFLKECLNAGDFEDAMGHCASIFAWAHERAGIRLTLEQARGYYKGDPSEIDEPPLKQLARQAE